MSTLPCTDGNQSQAQNRFHGVGKALCLGRQTAFVSIGTVELTQLTLRYIDDQSSAGVSYSFMRAAGGQESIVAVLGRFQTL
jgi:hypothetical protein